MNRRSNELGERLAVVLLACLSVALTLAVFAGIGWYRAAAREVSLDRLSVAERHELLEEALERSPGIYEATWYQPGISYTLERDTVLEAWGDRFRSNELGFRTRPARKNAGTFRILFVGDSWTYGMGIREQETFPRVLEALAGEHSGESKPGLSPCPATRPRTR